MTTLADFDFEEIKVIGRGQYGKAHLVKSNKDENMYVAKTIDLTCLSSKERQTSLQEVTLLRRLAHPNIVDYKDNFFMGDTLVIIMQHCDCGDLASYIKDMSRRKMKLREVQIMKYFVQVLHALQYIHQERILHRDLKTSNLFLLKRRTLLKVGDFGISRVLEGSVQAAITVVGTPYYMPPEVCENKPYTYKSDVWALGCVLYELCQLRHAFCADNLLGLVYKIVSDKYEPIPRLYSQALNTLVQRTLEKVADKRPSVEDLLSDAYVQSFVTEYARTQQRHSGAAAAPKPPGADGPAPDKTAGPGAKAWGGRGQAEGEAAKDAGGGAAAAAAGAGAGAGAAAPAAAGAAAAPGAERAARRSGAGGEAGGAGGRGAGRGAGARGRTSRGPFRGTTTGTGGAGGGGAAGAGRAAGRTEMPREASLRRRREAIERKGEDLKPGVRHTGRTRSLAQKVKQVELKAPEAAPLEVTPLDPADPSAALAEAAPGPESTEAAEATVTCTTSPAAACPASPANSSTESTTFEESTPKPNEAWGMQDCSGSLSPENFKVPRPLESAAPFSEERGSLAEQEREASKERTSDAPEEISDTMSSAEEYEDDFEEEYEGEDDFDKDYLSVAEEVDEGSEIEDMEVGSVELGNLPMVPEEEEYTRVLSHFETDFARMRSTMVSPPTLRRVAVDRVSVGLPGHVLASVPGALPPAGLGATLGLAGGGLAHAARAGL